MASSMTGFGRYQSDESSENFLSIEIKSVNNRYLDINVRLPKFMFALEEEVRKLIKARLNRGKVDVFINYKSYNGAGSSPKLDIDLAKKYYLCLRELSDSLQITDDITVSKLAKFPDVINIEEKEEDLEKILLELSPLVDKSLDMLIELRNNEGEKLKEDILIKLSDIEKDVKYIEEISKDSPKNYKKRLEDRLLELTHGIAISEERIATEIAIFADKVSVDEEIIRMYSHISQVRANLNSDVPIGRKLDFIIQEMNRETNTMGSKANDMNMTNTVINIKNTLEKIREQVQNIE